MQWIIGIVIGISMGLAFNIWLDWGELQLTEDLWHCTDGFNLYHQGYKPVKGSYHEAWNQWICTQYTRNDNQ